MTRLLTVAIAVVFVGLFCGAYGNPDVAARDGIRIMTLDQFFDWFCKNNPASNWASFCNSARTTTTPNSNSWNSGLTTTTPSTTSQSTTSFIPVSQRDRWCQFRNGTYLPLRYTFMHTECALCQCTESREIRCTNLQCMPTYCVDGSAPSRRPGQCCPQCAYENQSTPCVINGVSLPHGTVLRRTSDNVQCWCQLGGVECRKASNSLFSGMDYWGSGSAVYVIVVIICVILIFGTLLCCSGTLLFYYYYKRQQQQAAQQSYAEYYNNAGWQPMSEEEQAAQEKEAEAAGAQNPYATEYPAADSEQHIPPPYAIYNGSYESEKL